MGSCCAGAGGSCAGISACRCALRSPPEDSGNLDKVKAAVLRAYELVPEAYRQTFRRLRKQQGQTFVELVHENETLFDRWCCSSGVTDFNEFKQLVLMEDFKNCLPEVVSTFLNEHSELLRLQ